MDDRTRKKVLDSISDSLGLLSAVDVIEGSMSFISEFISEQGEMFFRAALRCKNHTEDPEIPCVECEKDLNKLMQLTRRYAAVSDLLYRWKDMKKERQ